MNYGNICKIDHHLTRSAIVADQHNPRLRAAFPECFEGESTPVPWSFIEDKTARIDHSITIEQQVEKWREQGIPVSLFWDRKDEEGRIYLPPQGLILKSHRAFISSKGATVDIYGLEYVLLRKGSRCNYVLAIPKLALDMTK